jgi:hypothetical protein
MLQRSWKQSAWMQQQRQEQAALEIQTQWRRHAAQQLLAR